MTGTELDGIRLDRALVERGLARSRGQAQAMVAAGQVWVNGVLARRASSVVGAEDRVQAEADHYVSRGSHKLLGALDDLGVRPTGRALDAGASTGGFTQVLLERGCAPVYAVDVGTGQLAPSLRSDPRVVVRERTSVRDLSLDQLDGEAVDAVVADLSFISLGLVLGGLLELARPGADLIVLVKPQFEVGRTRLGKNGVVRDAALRAAAVRDVADLAARLGRPAQGCARSRHPGPNGNVEFFLWLREGQPGLDVLDGVDFA